MAEQRARQGLPEDSAPGGILHLAMRLGTLLEPQETTRGVLEACATFASADAGLLLAKDLPVAVLGIAVPSAEELQAIGEAPAIKAAAQLIGVSALPPGSVPLAGPALLGAALPSPEGQQGVLLLSRSAAPTFERDIRITLAAALPLAGQALLRARRHARLRDSELARNGAVGRLAHDIRSPLVAAHASIEVVQRLLRTQGVPEAIFDALGTGLRSVQTAVELCNDLLEVSRLQSGFVIVPRPVPLQRLVTDACLLMDALAKQRGITLTANTPDPTLQALGDERLLNRLLSNLVANGLRFAPSSGFVSVEALPGERAGLVLLRVSDNGPGVPTHERERVFVPFLQGRGEESRGVGLGLALCQEIAHAHGGQVTIDDRAGGGTVFVVRLPAA